MLLMPACFRVRGTSLGFDMSSSCLLLSGDADSKIAYSGVNPMITNMAISDWISKGIAKDLQVTDKFEERARL